jgi:anti-sigma28 factor (negative regulator of flagellin synthesis)
MNEIKFDNIENYRHILNTKAKADIKPKETSINGNAKDEGISVNLSSFIQEAASETSLADNARVSEMKQRIQSNNYQMNTDALAQKLLPLLVKTQ